MKTMKPRTLRRLERIEARDFGRQRDGEYRLCRVSESGRGFTCTRSAGWHRIHVGGIGGGIACCWRQDGEIIPGSRSKRLGPVRWSA